jgi:uncharacterized protein Veg
MKPLLSQALGNQNAGRTHNTPRSNILQEIYPLVFAAILR